MGTAYGPREQRSNTGASAHGSGGPFRILKPGQGTYVRSCTAAAGIALAILGAQFLNEQLQVVFQGDGYMLLRTLVTVAGLLAALFGIFYVVGRMQTVVDFMIATEGEMKKVNWSTRKEVWGATRVVIVTVLALGLLLAVVDALFMLIFGSIGVLENIRVLDIFTGGGEV